MGVGLVEKESGLFMMYSKSTDLKFWTWMEGGWHHFCCLVNKSFPTLCNPVDCSMPCFPVLHYLLEFAQTHKHWVSDAIQPSHLSPPSVLALELSSIRVFSNESALLIRLTKYWSFNFSNSSSNEYSGLISFSIDWLDLLGVQGTLKSLLQHHSLKTSILQHLAFFMIHFSHPYMGTGKTTALTTHLS